MTTSGYRTHNQPSLECLGRLTNGTFVFNTSPQPLISLASTSKLLAGHLISYLASSLKQNYINVLHWQKKLIVSEVKCHFYLSHNTSEDHGHGNNKVVTMNQHHGQCWITLLKAKWMNTGILLHQRVLLNTSCSLNKNMNSKNLTLLHFLS